MTRLFTLLVFALSLPAQACIWDRDTLAAEARGTSTIDAITGRFPRYPAKYYEMRLKRVSAALKADPSRLALYDDAGAACDRLHRGDEAIAWMAKKKAVLDQQDDDEHRYRYHANLGTFVIHQWLRAGASAEHLDPVRAARDHIARAIEINPDAHFGREKYQLMAIEWLLEVKEQLGEVPPGEGLPTNFLKLETYRGLTRPEGILEQQGIPDAVEGISGLVQLGDGWESVDIFHALRRALQARGDSSMALLAQQRIEELLRDGKSSLRVANESLTRASFPVENQEPVIRYYQRSRENAERYHEERTAHLEAGLSAGRHPDTHPDFWSGYQERPAMKPPNRLALAAGMPGLIPVGLFLLIFAVAMLVLAVMIFRLFRRT